MTVRVLQPYAVQRASVSWSLENVGDVVMESIMLANMRMSTYAPELA
jgi:hypothetical protein